MQKNQPTRFVRWSLTIGIVIVLNMFFNYAISLFYKAPEYPSAPQVVGQYGTKEACLSVGGQWNENIGPLPEEKSSSKTAPLGYCDPDYTVRNHYEEIHKTYERNVFVVLVILGIASIVAGVLLAQEVLSAAFAWGGVLSLLIASMRYWSDAGNILKVIILLVALIALIVVALKRFSREN